MAFTPDTSNTMFNLAVDLVNQSCRNIFLTGKAGTGKTTFLKYIRENCLKQMAVVAPTGVAAINAGGVTIHSFFQLPFSPFIPESKGFGMNNEVADRHDLLSRMKLTREKRKTIQELELLIIDEISMVRCDTLDAIDAVLRQIRQRRFEQFGGVQVLFVGDMFQLPPVVAGSEWQILSEYYDSPYFFDSMVIAEKAPVHIEFTKIYRQSEERLISLLNQIRNNELTEEGNETLGSRFIPGFNAPKDEGYILLTTHNRKADTINIEELQKINAKQYEFRAVIEGEFPEKACPAEMGLTLKAGAQVMFLKNDTSDRGRRYFNGKIGVVTRIEDEKVFVQCQDEPFEIDVVKETWKNIRYTLNKNSRKLDEEVLGSFIQYPLRLAWAITIHKSQGLTFEKAIIDAEEAFAPGQVYVALSRCTCLSGMILESKIHPRCLHIDNRIVAFSKSNSSHTGLLTELALAKKDYQSILLHSLFNFSISVQYCKEIFGYVAEHSSSFNVETLGWLESLYQNIQDIQEVAIKFQSRLKVLFVDEDADGLNVQQRITAASMYFNKRLDEVLDYLQKSPAVTDSRLHAKEYNDALKEIFAQFAFKKHLLRGFEQGFSLENYQQRKQKFVLPSCNINAYAPASRELVDSPHPVLHQQLRRLRDSICAKKDLPVYYVVTGKTLDELACYLPQTLDELEKISGFGKAKIENYGLQFLEIITKYSLEQGLSSQIHNKSPKRQRKAGNNTLVKKSDTRAASFELFKKGMSVADIAKQRGFAIQTIEGHLAYYVSQGAINIKEFVGNEKLLLIEEALKDYTSNAIAPIKAKLSSSISFGEIRLVIAWHQFQNNNR